MSELPEGWAHVSVDDLAAREPRAITDGPFGSNLKTEHYQEAGPRVIRLQNIGECHFKDEKAHISEEHFASLRNHEVRAGDVLVAMLGEKLPRACLAPPTLGLAIVKADCARVRIDPNLAYAPFVSYALNSDPVRREASELIHGVGRPRLGLSLLRTVKVPLAPLVEQRHVVQAIESYLSRLDEATALLERVQRNLKRYRASVLKAAVEGRLVPTEAELARAEKRDYEPAAVLLKRILVERSRQWEKEGRRGKYLEPVPPDTKNLPDLPNGWCWATTQQLCATVADGDHQPPPQTNSGVPFLVIGNVRNGELSFDNTRFVAKSYYDQLDLNRRPKAGDVLYTVTGSFGIPVLLRTNEPFCVQRHIAILRPLPSTKAGLLYRFLASPFFFGQAATIATGIAQMTVPLQGLRRLVIPLPPSAEQERIITELDRLFSLNDDAATLTNASLARCQRLRQSILKWAFEGKLVDQDPNDEPASALLARIRAERGK